MAFLRNPLVVREIQFVPPAQHFRVNCSKSKLAVPRSFLNRDQKQGRAFVPIRQKLSSFRTLNRTASKIRASSTTTMSGIGEPLPGDIHKSCIYLDYNATTPIFPEVAEEMSPFLFEHFGNPSSSHAFARPCAEAVRLARSRLAAMISCAPEEIIFTSCGSESDNLAIIGAVEAARKNLPPDATPHVVSTSVEHPAILECLSALKEQGRVEYSLVEVDSEGLVSPEAVEAAITQNTVLVTVMHSNNEVGSIMPVQKIAALARARGVLVHTDAAQSIGKVKVKADELGVDMITVVGHKFGAPKGVGCLYIRGTSQSKVCRVQHGGGQEGGRRAGTESVLLLAGLGKAAELVEHQIEETSAHMRQTRDLLQKKLLAICSTLGVDARVNGPSEDPDQRLPNTLSVAFSGVNASGLLADLSDRLAASAGSACHSDAASISPVLKAMKVPEEFAMGTLRLSTGRHTSLQEIERAVCLITEAIDKQLQER